MNKRVLIAVSMAAGMVWAFGVIWGATRISLPFMPVNAALMTAFFPGGLLTVLMIGRLAQRRFFDDAIIDGQDFEPGSGAWVDQRVLANTVEQLVLALVLWPFVALTLGGQVVVIMGFAFALSRTAFWVGYHISPPLRGFGFASTFYTTVLAAIWSIAVWAF